MHVVNQWRRYSGKANVALCESCECLSCIDCGKRLLVSPCGSVLEMSKPVMGSLVPQSIKKKRARGKFEEELRKNVEPARTICSLKRWCKGKTRKKKLRVLVIIWWVRGTCWPVLGTITQGRWPCRAGFLGVVCWSTGSDGFTDQKMKLFIHSGDAWEKETWSSPRRKSEVMEEWSSWPGSVAGASSERGEWGESSPLWKVRTEGREQGGSLPISVSREGHLDWLICFCTDCLQLQRVQLLAHGPYWPLWHLRG